MKQFVLPVLALCALTALAACSGSDVPQTRSQIDPTQVWVVGGYR